MKPKRGRDAALDTLKLCACFAVIVIHISGRGVAALDVRSGSWLACTLWDCLARFAVPSFLMCTGALLLSPKKTLDTKTVWKKYFWKILRILWFWGWMYLLFDVAGKAAAGTPPKPGWLWGTVRDTLLFRDQIHLYYLQMLLLVYACLPVLRVFTTNASGRELNYALGIWAALGILAPVLRGPIAGLGGVAPQMTMNMMWSSLGFALLGYLSSQAWFYTGLGVAPNIVGPNDALALLLFMLAVTVLSLFLYGRDDEMIRNDPGLFHDVQSWFTLI